MLAHNRKNKTDDMMIAEDIWTEMRYQMWDDKPEPKSHSPVDSRKPLKISNEPDAKIEVEKGMKIKPLCINCGAQLKGCILKKMGVIEHDGST